MTVKGKTAVYGRVHIERTESTVTLNMLLRRSLVEVSIPGGGARQVSGRCRIMADDLATIRRLNEDTATKNTQATQSKEMQQPVRKSASDSAKSASDSARRQPTGRLKPDKKRLMPLRPRPVQSQQRECGELDPCRRV